MKFKQLKIVKAGTAEQFEERFNSAMRQLADSDPEFDFRADNLAYIFYTASDEGGEVKKVAYTCGDCPYMEDDGDRRRKWHHCKFANYGMTKADSDACELFQQMKEKNQC